MRKKREKMYYLNTMMNMDLLTVLMSINIFVYSLFIGLIEYIEYMSPWIITGLILTGQTLIIENLIKMKKSNYISQTTIAMSFLIIMMYISNAKYDIGIATYLIFMAEAGIIFDIIEIRDLKRIKSV